jgi:hypothetical protein
VLPELKGILAIANPQQLLEILRAVPSLQAAMRVDQIEDTIIPMMVKSMADGDTRMQEEVPCSSCICVDAQRAAVTGASMPSDSEMPFASLVAELFLSRTFDRHASLCAGCQGIRAPTGKDWWLLPARQGSTAAAQELRADDELSRSAVNPSATLWCSPTPERAGERCRGSDD